MPENKEKTGNKAKKNATSFKPGQSGNPRGRPKMTQDERDALEIMRAAAPKAARFLTETAMDESVRMDLRVRCAETVMDRIYGKASQPIDGNFGAEIKIVMEGLEEYGR